MIFKNLSKMIEEFESLIDKANQPVNLTREENDSIDCIDFFIAQSIIKDIGKSTSLQIADHILAHYIDDIEY